MNLAQALAIIIERIDARLFPEDAKPFPPERSGLTTASPIRPGAPVRKTARSGGKHNSQTMSANPYADHSDFVLSRIADFFRTYKPTYQDREWAAMKKAQVEAEIERRKAEDEEARK